MYEVGSLETKRLRLYTPCQIHLPAIIIFLFIDCFFYFAPLKKHAFVVVHEKNTCYLFLSIGAANAHFAIAGEAFAGSGP